MNHKGPGGEPWVHFSKINQKNMPCTITSIDQTMKSCIDAIGGLKSAALIDAADVTAATVAAGKISAFTVSGSWVPFRFDRDKTAYVNSVTERPSQFLTYKNIEGMIKFADPTEDDIVAANNIDCCTVVAVLFGNNGSAVVIGLELNPDGDDIQDPYVDLRVNANIYFPAGDEESRIEYAFVGQQKNLPPYTGDEASVGIT